LIHNVPALSQIPCTLNGKITAELIHHFQYKIHRFTIPPADLSARISSEQVQVSNTGNLKQSPTFHLHTTEYETGRDKRKSCVLLYKRSPEGLSK